MEHATVEDRLFAIQRRLIAMEGTVRLITMDEFERHCGTEQIAETLSEDLRRCVDELTWLRNLPESLLKLAAPTDFEKDDEDVVPAVTVPKGNIPRPVISIDRDDSREGA